MNSRFARIALVLVLAAGCANNVHASGLDDFPRGTVLPAATTLIGWQSAFDITKAANPTGVISSIKLERENGVWVYRSETGVGTFRQSVRTDINASTGQVVRVRRSNVGGGDQRNLQNIAVSQSTITVSFAQAASIAEARVPGLQAYNIRLERSGSRPLSYKVELFVNGAAAEVRVNAATGAIVGVQTVGTPRPVGTTPPATGGGTTPPVALTGNALLLSNAISNALATEPAGTLILEAKFKVNRFQNVVEVKTVEAGSLAAEEISLTPSTGAIVRRENEGLDAGDAATAAALFNALAGQTAIGHASAISRALAARSGDVSEIEMQMQGAIAIYEVKIVQAGRERSVKVNAITGAIVR